MFNLATSTLTQLLATYGYLVVLLFVAIESTGIPFPGETMLLVAAIAAGTTHQLSIAWVIVAAALGAILGDNLGFWVGHEGGYRLLRRYGRYIRLDERRLKLGQYLFLKHGGKVVFFGRFVAVLRAWAAFLAGTNRMACRDFWSSMPPEPSSGPRSTAWEGTSSVTTFTGWSGRSASCSSCWPCSSSLRGSSSYAVTNSAWRTRRNGPCPAHWTSLTREGNVQGRAITTLPST